MRRRVRGETVIEAAAHAEAAQSAPSSAATQHSLPLEASSPGHYPRLARSTLHATESSTRQPSLVFCLPLLLLLWLLTDFNLTQFARVGTSDYIGVMISEEFNLLLRRESPKTGLLP